MLYLCRETKRVGFTSSLIWAPPGRTLWTALWGFLIQPQKELLLTCLIVAKYPRFCVLSFCSTKCNTLSTLLLAIPFLSAIDGCHSHKKKRRKCYFHQSPISAHLLPVCLRESSDSALKVSIGLVLCVVRQGLKGKFWCSGGCTAI